jgi:DNA polymerase-3 subunit epsilon
MFAIIDTETTGGNPAKDRIMEIAILVHDGEKVIEEFTTLINPKVPVAPFIRALTGINDHMLRDAPTFEEVAEKILELMDKSVFVAHNANFDYGVLRNEFRRIGKRFQAKQLCTVKLSRKILPGYSSYSLGKLSRDLGIELEGRHRAYGDASATAKLFTKLMLEDTEDLIRSMMETEYEDTGLTPNLAAETVEDLPEESGVYYLHDQNGKVLFLSKCRNIRRRVIEQLTEELPKDRFKDLRNNLYDITYEITGSELVAQLLEAEELKKHRPHYNFSQRTRTYKYGLYQFLDNQGVINLRVGLLSEGGKSIIEFTTRRSATSLLKRLSEKYNLPPELCGLAERIGQFFDISPAEYNKQLGKIFTRYQYRNPNFFIIGEGRSHHEQSVVWIEDHQYRGYGFFEPEFIENDIQSFKDFVVPKDNNPDVHRIIRSWLGRKTKDEIIKY